MTNHEAGRGARKLLAQGGNVPGAELSRIAERIQARRDAATPEASAERRTAILDGLRTQINGRDPETSTLRSRLTNPDRIDGATGVVSLNTED